MSSLFYIFLGVLCIIFSHNLASAKKKYVIINTNLGKVRGAVKKLDDGKKVKQFFGIPYAKPPVGELRWKETVPVESWKNVLDASKLYPPHCPQVKATLPDEVKVKFIVRGPMDEDCLYLNIYSPAYATPKSNLSVMVYIHGGGFAAGGAMDGDGTFLAALNGVIMVSINYRLGVLGFASFPGTKTKGNYGLFDQVMALKWIKDNIVNFGGNPDSITIYGYSAGGASVSFLALSPLSKGLFRRAVSHSGTPGVYWSLYESQDYSFMKEFGSYLNCSGEMGDLQKCLQDKTVDEILIGQEKLSMVSIFSLIPRVDGKFLPEHPVKLLENGQIHDVEYMIGVNQNEADMMLYLMNMKTLPLSAIVGIFAGDQSQAVQDAIVYEYSHRGEYEATNEVLLQSSDFVNDYGYCTPADALARFVSKAGKNVRFFVFAHRNKHTVYPDWVRVSHGEDIAYTMGTPLNVSSQSFYTAEDFTEMEKGLSVAVMKMWGNFAKTGNPSSPADGVEWPFFTAEDPAYLEITLQPEVKRGLKLRAMSFWNEYIPKLKKNLETIFKK